MTDVERRDRLSAAIRAAMAGRTAQDVADAMDPKRSKETIARWARGETVPSALDVGPLAAALGVRAELLINPPEVPRYPLADYLLEAADSGAGEGHRRATTHREREAPGTPARSRAPRPRAAGAGRQ
jgi:transcriptional regulator with XRE-family HTH domain